MLKLNQLEVGKKYAIVYDDKSEDIFTYMGTQSPIMGEHNVLTKDGCESFLIERDIVKELPN